MPRDVNGMPQMSKEDKDRERRYRAEDDFRTLGRAAEIHGDEDRKNAVIEMHQEHGDMLKKLFSKEGGGEMKPESKGAGAKKKEPNYSRKRSS